MTSPVTITMSGPVGSGKSKLLAEIVGLLRALRVPYQFETVNMKLEVENDMRESHVDFLDLYQPFVTLVERHGPDEQSGERQP